MNKYKIQFKAVFAIIKIKIANLGLNKHFMAEHTLNKKKNILF